MDSSRAVRLGKYGKLRTLGPGVSQLGPQDLGRALRFAQHAQATSDLQSFVDELVPELRELVACDWVGYNEIDFGRERAVVASDARRFDGMEERFFELSDQHPLLTRRREGDLRTCMFSDFLTAKQFHRLELYQDFYRLREIEDQVSLGLPGETSVTVALSRSRRGFRDSDRHMLELARPHLSLAYARARRETRLQALLEALTEGRSDARIAVVQLDANARIDYAAGSAAELLDEYFQSPCAPEAIPVELECWLRSDRPNVLIVDGDDAFLRVRRQPGGSGRWTTLVLEERRRVRTPDVETLRTHGLTERQAQVLELVARGRQNQQIAAELRISVATVSKHLEHIYVRLDVNNRTEALARVQTAWQRA
jgi:DNA-binding CsgD family transcriptional regulator